MDKIQKYLTAILLTAICGGLAIFFVSSTTNDAAKGVAIFMAGAFGVVNSLAVLCLRCLGPVEAELRKLRALQRTPSDSAATVEDR